MIVQHVIPLSGEKSRPRQSDANSLSTPLFLPTYFSCSNVKFFVVVALIRGCKLQNGIILGKLTCRFEAGRNTAGIGLRRWPGGFVALLCTQLPRDQR
jgi:hypothetical protein